MDEARCPVCPVMSGRKAFPGRFNVVKEFGEVVSDYFLCERCGQSRRVGAGIATCVRDKNIVAGEELSDHVEGTS